MRLGLLRCRRAAAARDAQSCKNAGARPAGGATPATCPPVFPLGQPGCGVCIPSTCLQQIQCTRMLRAAQQQQGTPQAALGRRQRRPLPPFLPFHMPPCPPLLKSDSTCCRNDLARLSARGTRRECVSQRSPFVVARGAHTRRLLPLSATLAAAPETAVVAAAEMPMQLRGQPARACLHPPEAYSSACLAAFSLSRTSDMKAARNKERKENMTVGGFGVWEQQCDEGSVKRWQHAHAVGTQPSKSNPAPANQAAKQAGRQAGQGRRQPEGQTGCLPPSRRSSRAAPRSSRLMARCSLRRSDRSLQQVIQTGVISATSS